MNSPNFLKYIEQIRSNQIQCKDPEEILRIPKLNRHFFYRKYFMGDSDHSRGYIKQILFDLDGFIHKF